LDNYIRIMKININEELKRVLEEIKPLKLKKEENQELKELEMKASFLKIIKSLFMEEVIKNKKMNDALLKSGILTTHQEEAEKDGKKIMVGVIDQSMDERITMIPEDVQRGIFERLAKSHKENLALLKNLADIEKEKFELDILLSWLPKEAGREEIMAKLKELYPDGIDQKMMGPTIGRMKKEFERVDGKLLSECVKSWIK